MVEAVLIALVLCFTALTLIIIMQFINAGNAACGKLSIYRYTRPSTDVHLSA
jgi:hypothetical protein